MREQPAWRRYLRFLGTNVRGDVDDEFEFHIQTRVDELVRAGVPPDVARERAIAGMGDVAGAKRECVQIGEREHRRRRVRRRAEVLWQDLRYGVRGLVKSRGFTAVVVFTLALGIGATTTIFSLVNGVLLTPLRVRDADRLVALFEANPARSINDQLPSGPNYLDWRRLARSFTGMAAYRFEALTLTGVAAPDVLNGAGVSANFFDVLGVRPLMGRGFMRGEDEGGGAPVVMLSYGAWQQRFGGAPDVIGRALTLDRQPHVVVGVMPRGFAFPTPVDAWRPTDLSLTSPTAGLTQRMPESRQARYLGVFGRLAPGVTSAAAAHEMREIASSLAHTYPFENEGWTATVVPLRDVFVRNVEPVLLLTLGATGLVLLIACANVANLALGRAIAREPELAVRAALGAGRGRLARQLVTESLVLAASGGAAGVALAWGSVRLLRSVAPASLPRIDEVAIDGRVILFALAVSLLSAVLFGLAPSLRVAGADVSSLLREGGRGNARRSGLTRRVLVIGEVALAVLVLVGAGLTLRSVLRLLAIDPGYATEHVVAAHVSLDGPRYEGNVAKARYLREVAERIRVIPGVERVAVTSTLPLTKAGIDFELGYHAEGQPEVAPAAQPRADYRMISPGYLDAMGIRLASGRDFTDADRIDSDAQAFIDSVGVNVGGHRVMLVNETFARRNWPGQSAVGKHVRLQYLRDEPWEVVGVVRDTRHAQLTAAPRPQVFVPVTQAELLFGYMTVVVRTRGDAGDVVPAMRAAALALDPTEPMYDVNRIEQLRADATERDRLTALVFAAFALLAMCLAAAGIYGVIAYQVAARTREIGVRIALGATRARVVRSVVWEAARLALAGIAAGVAGALAVSRFTRGVLVDIAPADPVTFAAVASLLLAVALAAALVPAARAAGIEPNEALRAE